MRHLRHSRLLLSTLAVTLLAVPVQARAGTADSTRGTPSTKVESSRATPRTDDERMGDEVRAQVESHRAQARTFWEVGRMAQARREFLAAARLMRGAGVLPTRELLDAATIALVEERPRLAAEVMDTLAANAAALGQPLVQAQALLEATSQYAAAGQNDLATERYAVLRALLASPHIPDSFRAEVDARILVQR